MLSPLRTSAAIALTALVAGACGGAVEINAPASDEAAVAATEPEPTPAPSAEPEPTPKPEQPDPEPEAEATPSLRQQAGVGAAGIGDSLYPNLGNGGYDVQSYDIALQWFPDDGHIEATTTIDAITTDDLAAFNLDFVGLTVDEVLVDGQPAEFTRDEPELVISPVMALTAGAEFVVAVEYSGVPAPVGLDTFTPVAGWTTTDDGIFVAGEPTGASGWYPVNDHPRDRAAYRFAITVPPDYEVAANGTLEGTEAGDDGVTWRFDAPNPMSSYLVTLAIDLGLVEVEQGEFDGVLLRHYFDVEIADAAGADTVRLPEVLAFFSEQFGPYPFDTYGHLVVDATFGAALETQTLSIFSADTISGDSASVSAVVAHELAHQWFGDYVGPADWSDIWLNEGFATYAELLWAEHDGLQSVDEVAGFVVDDEFFSAVPPGSPPADDLFNASVYFRGAVTLHALRLTVGDDAFTTILREWVTRFGGGTASTADFIALSEEISGSDLGAFFDGWLFSETVPELPS